MIPRTLLERASLASLMFWSRLTARFAGAVPGGDLDSVRSAMSVVLPFQALSPLGQERLKSGFDAFPPTKRPRSGVRAGPSWESHEAGGEPLWDQLIAKSCRRTMAADRNCCRSLS